MSNSDPGNKLRKLLRGNVEETIKSRLPRRIGTPSPDQPASSPPLPGSKTSYNFLPAFWTVTGILSIIVNVVLLAVALIALQMLGTIQLTANDQFSGLLGGLYENFVKMDEAHIKTNILVQKEIPVQFTLNVSGATNVVLTDDVTINNALVTVQTGGLNIVNAQATIVLRAGTPLPVNIQNLVVPVDQRIPITIDVPVDIALNQTDLHIPFMGLQNVVKPFYCLVEPNAIVNNVQICSPLQQSPALTEPVTP